jgi:hypothetical protein
MGDPPRPAVPPYAAPPLRKEVVSPQRTTRERESAHSPPLSTYGAPGLAARPGSCRRITGRGQNSTDTGARGRRTAGGTRCGCGSSARRGGCARRRTALSEWPRSAAGAGRPPVRSLVHGATHHGGAGTTTTAPGPAGGPALLGRPSSRPGHRHGTRRPDSDHRAPAAALKTALTPETRARTTTVADDPHRRGDGGRDATARRGQPRKPPAFRVKHAESSYSVAFRGGSPRPTHRRPTARASKIVLLGVPESRRGSRPRGRSSHHQRQCMLLDSNSCSRRRVLSLTAVIARSAYRSWPGWSG